MEIVVEVKEQGQRKSRIEWLDTEEFSVGRGWDADIHIQDEEVDAEHLWFELDEDNQSFLISDCETVNGSKVGGSALEQMQTINFGEWIHIGRSQLRIHAQADQVEPARKRSSFDYLLHKFQSHWLAIGLLLLALLAEQYFSFVDKAFAFKWERGITEIIGVLSGIIIWAIFWGSINRLIKREFQIWLHVTLASLFTIAILLFTEFTNFISFNALSTTWSSWSETIVVVLAGSLWLMITLYVGTNLGARARTGIIAALVAVFVLTSQILPQIRSESWVAFPGLVTTSRPPSWLVASVSDKDSYMLKIDKAFESADQKAIEINAEKEEKEKSK